jgi:hypothetical protein
MDFKLRNGEQVRTVLATKDSATVIEAGDLVALSSGVLIKAVAGSAAIAYAPKGAAAGVTECEVTVWNDFELVGTNENVFAVTMKGAEVDIIGTTTLLINDDASSTDVLKIAIDKNAGTVGSTAGVVVKINKPLF